MSEPIKVVPPPTPPVVIDLGKQRSKRVKELRKGEPGKLLSEVEEAIAALRAEGTISPTAQPVIVVVREKKKKRGVFGFSP